MGLIVSSIEELEQKISTHRGENKTIVAVNGCFDAFHPGHDFFLTEAKKQGDILLVLVNSDQYIKDQKGRGRPLHNEKVRLKHVAMHPVVDYVFMFSGTSPTPEYEILKPNVYCTGVEYAPHPIEEEVILAGGGKIHFIERMGEHSTTNILLAQGKIALPKKRACPKHGKTD